MYYGYYGHINSHIKYGLMAWGSMAQPSQLAEIFKIEKQCVKIIQGTTPAGEINSQFKSLRILSIYDLNKTAMCKLGYKISHDYSSTTENYSQNMEELSHIDTQLEIGVNIQKNIA